MGKRLTRMAALLLMITLAFPPAVLAAGGGADAVIRAGLFYGSSALAGANLENSVGSGYRFGYFDDNLDFYPVGSTAETQISMVKSQNVTLSNGNYVDGTGGISVGCYHVQLPTVYASFAEAQTAASGVQNGFPAWIEGTYYVRSGAYTTKDEALAAQQSLGYGQVVGTSGYAVTVVVTKTGRPIFQFDGGASLSLGVMPGLDDSVKSVTWCRGFRYYGGFQYLRKGGGNLTVINVVPLEDYIRGVLPYEMSNDWPLEALKAQAVCARTYALSNPSGHGKDGFDVCNTTHCQMYQGLNLANDRTDQAVEETAGQCVRYQGELAITYYSASDGGATEDVRNIWNPSADLPHLKGVIDPYEADLAEDISQYYWSKTFTKQELTGIIQGMGAAFSGTVTEVYVAETSPTGNPITITFVDSNGKKWSFNSEKLRTNLGLRSNRFTISGSGEGAAAGTEGAHGGGYYVNGSTETISSMSGVYAVDGSGAVSAIGGEPYAATASGTERLEGTAETGGATAGTGSGSDGNTVTFTGSGWGHNVGMSQQGARAMALRGMTYLDILQFYFTGVEIW